MIFQDTLKNQNTNTFFDNVTLDEMGRLKKSDNLLFAHYFHCIL